MKNYVDEFEKRIAKINEESRRIRIINAGIMNHGKSSLFNSILDEEHFVEQDIRTTMVNKEIQWFDDVYLVDTPGLSAEISDDIEAYNAYQNANMIVFCHTAKVGELHSNELKAINNMKRFFENDKFFWEHFCLVITFLDSDSQDNINVIKEKSLADIYANCEGEKFPIFLVSNSRYKKGKKENKEGLIKLSGILELREYLKEKTGLWRKEIDSVRMRRIRNEKENIIDELNNEKKCIESRIKIVKNDIKSKQKYFYNKLENIIIEKRYNDQNLEEKRRMLNSLEEDLNDLKEKHNREYF